MSNPVYVSKNLVAASSTGIGTLSSAATTVATLNTSSLGTQRRITIWSTGSTLAGFTFTVIGTRDGGGTLQESITGPTSNAAVATTQDFLTVTSVLASSAPLTNTATIGTNTQGGTPWQSVNVMVTLPMQIGGALTFSTTTSSMVGQIDLTMDNPFLPPPAQVGGGMLYPVNAVPISFVSTVFSSGTLSNTLGAINAVGSAGMIPVTAWRLTLTSTSSGAGTVSVAAVQAGIG